MEEFGITFGHNAIYWNGRTMTDEAAREFIALDAPHAKRLREIFASLKTIDKYGIQVDHVWANGAREWIKLYCSDKYSFYEIRVRLYLPNMHEHAHIAGPRLDYESSNLEHCLEECGYTKIYDKLCELEASAAKVPALEEKILALEADIAERKLRPGGEEYEAAREHFESIKSGPACMMYHE